MAERVTIGEAKRRTPEPQSQNPSFATQPEAVPYIHRLSGSVPRFLLISDVRGWAFDINLCDCDEYLGQGPFGSHEFAFDFWYIVDYLAGKPPPRMDDYDGVYCPYHRWPIDHLLPWSRTVGSLRSAYFFPETKEPVGQLEFDLVNRYKAFHTVTRRAYDDLQEHCQKLYYLTNPVNLRRFPLATEVDEVVAEWNGNAAHANPAVEDVKGYHSLVVPSCKRAAVRLEACEYSTNRMTPQEMASFYTRGSVALCASSYEGASNSVMEAMACGLLVVSTMCGNIEELRDSQLKHYGRTGVIVVPRTVGAFAGALAALRSDRMERRRELSGLNRAEIERAWSWLVWRDRYRDFLMEAVK